jgi:glycosyltransferase involved in cell wall biosynthesis
MKVAFHVDQLWFDAPGGIGTYVEQLWRQQFARTQDVEIVPFFSRWSRRPPALAPLTTDGRFPGVEVPFSIRALYPAWAYLRRPSLPRPLADANIVHATNHAAIPPVRSEQDLVVTVHDLAFERFPELFPSRWLRLYRRGLRIARDEAARVIVPSESVGRDLAATGFPTERISVTPLGSSVIGELVEDEGLAGHAREILHDRGIMPPYVMSVGTIEPRKNLVRLVRAFRRLAAEGLPHSLVVVGDSGWGAAELAAELDRGGPGRIVRAAGLSASALAAAYADADAVAYVSLYEGFGLPVLEAMSMGAPVVTSNVSAMPEVAGDAALLVDPTDEDAIADALRGVLTDAALADDLRRKGRERAAGFSWERTAKATLDVYRLVAGERGGATTQS